MRMMKAVLLTAIDCAAGRHPAGRSVGDQRATRRARCRPHPFRRSRPRTSDAWRTSMSAATTSGAPGKEQMDGAMYVEVWVPKQIRQPYPDRDVPRQRSDRRRVAADARRRVPAGRITWSTRATPSTWWITRRAAARRTCPASTATLGIRTALDLEQIWTAPATSGGDFPRKNKYTQWPSNSSEEGMVGDPVFDNFIKGQMQFVSNQAELAVPAGIALLDRDRQAGHSPHALAGRRFRFRRRRAALAVHRRDGLDRAGRSADRQRRYGEGRLHAHQSRTRGG